MKMSSKEIKLYYSLDSSGSYAGKNTLYQAARKKFPEIKLTQVENWLSKQLTYALHKPVYQSFQTRPVVVYAIDELRQLDLVDLSKLARENDCYKFILSVIDVLSKYGWLLPLKSKHEEEIKVALTKLLEKTKRRPVMIQTDKGTEFMNLPLQNFLKKHYIKFFTTFSEHKAGIVERFNRTIKGIMFRLFTKNNNRRYIHMLNDIVNRYNSSYHRRVVINRATQHGLSSLKVKLFYHFHIPFFSDYFLLI